MLSLLNGELVAAETASIAAADRGFLLGDGVFDTLRIENGVAVDGFSHMARLIRHAAVLGIAYPRDAEALLADIAKLLQANDVGHGLYSLRTTLTRGIGLRGLRPPPQPVPNILMVLAPYTQPANDAPFRLCVSSRTRRNEFSPLSRIKSLNYGDNIVAMMEAMERGFDDAVMLNTKGNVTCATIGTFLLGDGTGGFITPPLADGAMDGITRASLIALGRCIEKTITLEMLGAESEIYICNSLTGLRFVTEFTV